MINNRALASELNSQFWQKEN